MHRRIRWTNMAWNKACLLTSHGLLILTFCMICAIRSYAQLPQYSITATLDTAKHTVTGNMEIRYTNNSKVTLEKIGIHLWANAYQDKNTALVQQMLRQGNFSLYKAREENRGGFSGLGFVSGSGQLPLVLDSLHSDIAWLILAEPLEPGQTIQLVTPFTLQIPLSYSRLGRTGDAYQLTQWYPHIGVLDSLGWHMMPYLDQGEFYNDFADYNVKIKAPPGYTLAATGSITSATQVDGWKEWTIEAHRVIDFAWFASPTFHLQSFPVDVGQDHEVTLKIYRDSPDNGLWDRATAYAARALQFYSDWLGPYPYPEMSVVSAPFSSGGYMEYPTVAQISYTEDSISLDLAIAHEIGHTWLYAILASDERTYPWMDEGLNSFMEWQYAAKYHPGYEEPVFPAFFSAKGSMRELDALEHSLRFQQTLEPPAAAPEDQSGDQYLFSAYVLPPQGLEMMQAIVGTEKMKAMFRTYFTEHQFTHVTPDDLQASFESSCQCDLNWFFDQWIHHAHEVDYRLEKFDAGEKEITLVNKSHLLVPLRITTYKDGKMLLDHWLPGFKGTKIIHLDDRPDEIRLYEGFAGINRTISAAITPHEVLPRFTFFPRIESYSKPSIGVTPVIGGNVADGFMPGLALTTGLLPQSRFKAIVTPMYGTASGKLRGFATLRYTGNLSGGTFDKYILSLDLDDFGYNLDTHYVFRDHYFKWSPSIAVRLTPAEAHSQLTSWLKYRYVHIDQYYGRGVDFDAKIYTDEHREYGVHELAWQIRSTYPLRPFDAVANLQAGQGFLRLNVNYHQHFSGKDIHHGLWVHGYGGWLPVYKAPDANVGFTFNGITSNGYYSRDYMYDEWLGGRNAAEGLFAHQVFEKDADLKTLSTIGNGDAWMLGAGFSAALPFRFIHAYMDAALYPSSVTEKTQFSYSGGAALVLWKDVFEVYIPFVESKDIRESLTYEVRDMWFERISFRANIKLANPLNIIDRIQLGY